jgi:uncharacterized protein YjbI with pentapeptide repeats
LNSGSRRHRKGGIRRYFEKALPTLGLIFVLAAAISSLVGAILAIGLDVSSLERLVESLLNQPFIGAAIGAFTAFAIGMIVYSVSVFIRSRQLQNLEEARKTYLQLMVEAGETQLSGIVLRELDLSGLDLSPRAGGESINLSYSTLVAADLSDANLEHANLRAADLSGAILVRADLQHVDLQHANLVGADLRGADLRSAILRDTKLVGARLMEADLQSADLAYAQLLGADVRRANLIDANLQNAVLDNILYDEATRWPEGFASPSQSS